VQLRGHDVLWQKERLFNLALDRLPSDCTKVVCMDCDVILERPDWLARMSRTLDRDRLVQAFSRAYRMPKDWAPTDGRLHGGPGVMRSLPFLIASGVPEATCLRTSGVELRTAMGLAWGVQRDLIEQHRFYDACIVGGGDGAFTRAAYGCFDDTMRLRRMNDRQCEHYLRWARPFNAAVAGSVSYVEGTLRHLWHGAEPQRRYGDRHERLAPFAFDPFTDIAVAENGAWRWNSDKPALHAYVRDYFRGRQEDG
jgi:hypothetical protein